MEPDTKSGKLLGVVPAKMHTITVENVSVYYDYFAAGAEFNVIGGDTTPPTHPVKTVTVHFHGGMNHKLFFTIMSGTSNDWFYTPDDDGIELFSGGSALEGDITSMVCLWDAGTEINEYPGTKSMDEEEAPSIVTPCHSERPPEPVRTVHGRMTESGR